MTAYAHKNRFVDGAMDFSPSAKESLAEQINKAIDKALEDENASQPPRGYLGGSRLGVECLRKLGYEWHFCRQKKHAVKFKGKTLRRFRMGHIHEDETARWLKLAGFDLQTHKQNGEQFGFYVANDPETGRARIAGHIDGCFISGPVALPYPCLWEHKIMRSDKWRACEAKGVAVSNPEYMGQCQTYMAYLDLKHTLFTALNTDTSELLFELIEFDAAYAQRLSDRGVQVIESANPEELPRITRDPNDFRCKWCDFSERCWKEPERPTGVSVPAPKWLTGGHHAS